mmetsp:Transcript_18658/g.37429  ORF Transcript_18658/g.37429 Transcript_18658/m.37429 type:complete len:198 (-) Transcript_18658:55-648(-)
MLTSTRAVFLRRLPLTLPHAHLPSPAFSDKRRRTPNPPTAHLSVIHSRTTALFHTTAVPQSATALAGLAGVALAAQVVRQGAIAYEEFSKQTPEDAAGEGGGEDGKKKSSPKKRENFFAKFGFAGPTSYYDGGFEDEMTRREAALILGVRESASATRIKNAHRQILIANHPDTGGSTFIASKVNEAKELLMKGKQDD